MTVSVTKKALNVREKLAELDKPTGIAGEAMLRAETPQEQFNLIGAGRRNILINGDFQVSQRGDFTTASSATSNYYWVDRWLPSLGTVTANWQHKVDQTVNGIVTNTARLEATSSATGYFQLYQKIEGYKVCLGREITMSAWVKSNYPVNLYCYDGASQIGYSENHPADGQWHKLTSTFILNASSGALSAYVSTYDKASSAITTGDYFEVALVQLELGKVATPFEHRSYGEELALCQRYFQVPWSRTVTGRVDTNWQGNPLNIFSTTRAFTKVSLPVTMRALPTVVIHNPRFDIAWNNTSRTLTSQPTNVYGDSQGVGLDLNNGGTNFVVGYSSHVDIGGGCHITLDAEL